ncbi:unnamed protein product, partial [marine sediment metagenome]
MQQGSISEDRGLIFKGEQEVLTFALEPALLDLP